MPASAQGVSATSLGPSREKGLDQDNQYIVSSKHHMSCGLPEVVVYGLSVVISSSLRHQHPVWSANLCGAQVGKEGICSSAHVVKNNQLPLG